MQDAYNSATEALARQHKRYAATLRARRSMVTFNVNDYVFIESSGIRDSRNILEPRREGPYKVLEVKDGVVPS